MALHHDPEKLHSIAAGGDEKIPYDYDKAYPQHHEGSHPARPGSNDPILDRFTDAEIKRIVRKVDIRLVPLCGLMYCVSLLDRTNLSNAAIAGYGAFQIPKRRRSVVAHSWTA